MSCDDGPLGVGNNENLLHLSGTTILYSLIGEDSIENRVYNSNTDKKLFANNSIRSNVRISPDKKTIAYVKNASLHPWFGYYTKGTPTVTISTDMGVTEKKLLSADSSSAFFLDWIEDDVLAVSSVEDGSPYLTILDTNGKILKRRRTSSVYRMCMLPDNKHLVAYMYKGFGVLDVLSYSFNEYIPGGEFSSFQTPFFIDSTFVMNCDDNGYKLLEFNLKNNSFEKWGIRTPNIRLVYANTNYKIFYNYVDNKVNLFKNGSQIKSVALTNYGCDSGLSLVNDNVFYFVGKVRGSNDEGMLGKVDFTSGKITKLTNHGINKFITDYVIYKREIGKWNTQ